MERIQLRAPSGLPIVGALEPDEVVHEFDYLHDRASQVGFFVTRGEAPTRTEPTLLVDAAGYCWSPREVEWYTLYERRNLHPAAAGEH
jgi:hypothetical protein